MAFPPKATMPGAASKPPAPAPLGGAASLSADPDLGGDLASSRPGVAPGALLGGGGTPKKKSPFSKPGGFSKGGAHGGLSKGGGVNNLRRGGRF